MSLKGKQVAVLGAGRSGLAAARLAHYHGAEVIIYDANVIRDELDIHASIKTVSGCDESFGKTVESDLLVVSPGIDTYSTYVAAFSEGAQEVIGEVELATRYHSGKIIAITGTNGKTTTTELVEKIIQGSGTSCVACGNYGVPVAEVVMRENAPEVLALEVSSFQLETIVDFSPDVAIWLNFDADHMDRYTSIGDYKKAKLRIFKNQAPEQVAVVKDGEDVDVIAARRITFSSEVATADYSLKGMTIMHDGKEILNALDTQLRGLHNMENLMAACAAAHALGVSDEQIAEAISDFTPPLHRCELVGTIDGVEYINDSKATNLHALDNALRSQVKPVVLLAGGKEKGLDYQPLINRVKDKVKALIVYGEIKESLAAMFSPHVSTSIVEDLENAVLKTKEFTEAGDVVLLSPGTSSFDMFSGYEARGNAFRNYVHAIEKFPC